MLELAAYTVMWECDWNALKILYLTKQRSKTKRKNNIIKHVVVVALKHSKHTSDATSIRMSYGHHASHAKINYIWMHVLYILS